MPGSKKVLIITYYWPPSGGAGVQRWLKFSKYLPEYGWDPVILTVDPKYAEYPALDESLAQDERKDIRVYRTKASNYFRLFQKTKRKKKSDPRLSGNNQNTIKARIVMFLRGNFFIPDPRRGWNRHAIRKALEIIDRENIEYIITTSPPHSTQLIGLKIKEARPGTKWIADFRDPWTRIYYYDNFHPTRIARFLDSRFESRVLKKSDIIFTVGNKLKEQFISIFPEVSDKMRVIYNGYDEADFSDLPRKLEGESLITYVGTLSDQYPLEQFIDTLQKFKSIQERKLIKFRIVGQVSDKLKQSLEFRLGKEFEFIPYANHREAINMMRRSCVLLLVIPDHKDNKVIVTGKIFEYLRSGRPIICIGPPDGEAATIIARYKAGTTIDYNDMTRVEDFLKKALTTGIPYSLPEEFTRLSIVRHVAEALKN